jgi:tetratricopeptide (TPR) repeat protein
MATARLQELLTRFEENPRRYFAPYANELRKGGDLMQAIDICRSHLAAQPAHVSGHIVLAQALHEDGAVDESRREFEAALELDPENLIALRYMGDIARARGEFAAARLWYERVLDADPRNDEISAILRELAAVPNESPAAAGAEAGDRAITPVVTPALREPEAAVTPAAGVEQWTATADLPLPDVVPMAAPAADQIASSATPEFEALETWEFDASADARALAAPEQPSDEYSDDFDSDEEEDDDVEDDEWLALESDDIEVDAEEAPAAASVSAESEEDASERVPGFALADEPSAADTTGDTIDLEVPDPSPAREATPPAVRAEGFRTPKSTPAVVHSDLESAPEDWLDEELDAALADSGRAATPEGSRDDDIEALFATPHVERTGEAHLDGPAHGSAGAPEPAQPPELEIGPYGDLYQEAQAANDARQTPRDEPAVVSPAAAAPEPEQQDPMIGRTPAFSPAVPEPAAPPFVTETLAELYLQQGFREEALSIYRQLSERDPNDDSLRRRIDAIEHGEASDVVPEVAAVKRSPSSSLGSVSVRTFFARLARRVAARRSDALPGGAAPASGMRSSDAPVPHGDERVPVDLAPATPSSAFAAPSALAQLFAAGRHSESDTAAASALATAFSEPGPGASGRPSRVAEQELSLDHLFRDSSGSRSDLRLGEYPAGHSRAASAPDGTTGREGEDRSTDIRQFNAWLEGLKKK